MGGPGEYHYGFVNIPPAVKVDAILHGCPRHSPQENETVKVTSCQNIRILSPWWNSDSK